MMTLPGITWLAHLRGSEAMLQAEVGEPIGGWKCCDESWVVGVSRKRCLGRKSEAVSFHTYLNLIHDCVYRKIHRIEH